MSAYEEFFPYVMTEVAGVPEPVAIMAIRNTCIDFCEKSLILNRDHDPVTIVQGITDYDLEPPRGYLVVKVMRAWLDNRELSPSAPDFVTDAAVYNRLYASYQSAPNMPQTYIQKQERSITVWPVPDRKYKNGLTLRVALKPTRSSTEIEDLVFEDYAETIGHGAVFRLMSSVGKPYTNLDMAAVHKSLYEQGLNVARNRATHGNTRVDLRVKLRRI
jgi:hypothetical protein